MTGIQAPRCGILPVDKPAGPTSHDVVAAARKALGIRRIGHTGTLDPFASGLLLLLVGSLTRLSPYLTGQEKEYDAIVRLGQRTDSDDVEGVVLEERSGWEALTLPSIERALPAFRGPLLQTPPTLSAKKIGGEAAHRRVRRGEAVVLDPVPVTVHALTLRSWEPPRLGFSTIVSSGTYIRSLGRDLGEALGVGGHLVALRRQRIGVISVRRGVPMDALQRGEIEPRHWLDPLEALAPVPVVRPEEEELTRLQQGQVLSWPLAAEGDPGWAHERPAAPGHVGMVAVARRERLVAMGEVVEGRLRPRTVLPLDGSCP